MKNSFVRFLFIAGLMAGVAVAAPLRNGSPAAQQTDADRAWAQVLAAVEQAPGDAAILQQIVPAMLDGKKAWDPDSEVAKMNADFMMRSNARSLRYRQLGLAFYDRFPQDPRRWVWLGKTVGSYMPIYIKDEAQARRAFAARAGELIERDEEAAQRWRQRYYADLKPAFLKSREAPEVSREEICYFEVANALIHEQFAAVARGEAAVDEGRLQRAILEYGKLFPGEDFRVLRLVGEYVDGQQRRLETPMLQTFIAAMKISPNAALRAHAVGMEQMTLATGSPLRLKGKALDGSEVDIAALRGKVVLIDFWSTSCTSCVEGMPEVKRIREIYRAHGLEVIGVDFNEEHERPQVMALMRKLDIPWPQVMRGKLMDERNSKDFGFSAVPWYFILDKQGLVVERDYRASALEQLVRKHLGLAPLAVAPAKPAT